MLHRFRKHWRVAVHLLGPALLLLTLLSQSFVPRAVVAGGNSDPAQVVFADAPEDRLRSDDDAPPPGSTLYKDGENVVCWVGVRGNLFLRTAMPDPPSSVRYIGVDFTGAEVSGTRDTILFPDPCSVPEQDENPNDDYVLNTCGVEHLYDVRFFAPEVFAAGATTTPVTLSFSKTPDFRGESDFSLSFDSVPITATGASRVLTATLANGSARAHLYRNRNLGRGRWVREHVADFDLPFSATVSRL